MRRIAALTVIVCICAVLGLIWATRSGLEWKDRRPIGALFIADPISIRFSGQPERMVQQPGSGHTWGRRTRQVSQSSARLRGPKRCDPQADRVPRHDRLGSGGRGVSLTVPATSVIRIFFCRAAGCRRQTWPRMSSSADFGRLALRLDSRSGRNNSRLAQTVRPDRKMWGITNGSYSKRSITRGAGGAPLFSISIPMGERAGLRRCFTFSG